MFALITKLLNGTQRRQPRTGTRLALEHLETREVLSTSSGALHAVSPVPGHESQENAFYISAQTQLLVDDTTAINGKANTPVGVKAISAGHDANGFADVFATDSGGSLWKDVQGGWTKIKSATSDTVESFAAVDDGRLYAVLQNVSTKHIAVEEYNGSSWTTVPVSGTPKTLDANSTASNTDTVFVQDTDGSLWDYVQFSPGSSFLSDELFLGGTRALTGITTFSAGLDSGGEPEVYASIKSKLGTTSLEKIREGSSPSSWLFIAPGTSYKSFSATTNGEVWVAGANNSIYEYDQFGHIDPNTVFSSASAVDLSAASSTDVYFATSNKSLKEFVQYPNFSSWIENNITNPGAVQL
jgi:hypothetical protein